MYYVNTDSGNKLKMAYKKCIWGKGKNKNRNVAKSGKSVFYRNVAKLGKSVCYRNVAKSGKSVF